MSVMRVIVLQPCTKFEADLQPENRPYLGNWFPRYGRFSVMALSSLVILTSGLGPYDL